MYLCFVIFSLLLTQSSFNFVSDIFIYGININQYKPRLNVTTIHYHVKNKPIKPLSGIRSTQKKYISSIKTEIHNIKKHNVAIKKLNSVTHSTVKTAAAKKCAIKKNSIHSYVRTTQIAATTNDIKKISKNRHTSEQNFLKKKRTKNNLNFQIEIKKCCRYHRDSVHTQTDFITIKNYPSFYIEEHYKVYYQQAKLTALMKLISQIGKPYLWGGNSPATGFDCSGLIYYAYKDLIRIPLPRTTNEMYHLRDAVSVKKSELEIGDLVFFRIHNRNTADHVGAYLGNGRFIQSPRTGQEIRISYLNKSYWQNHYVGARRIIMPTTIR